MLSASEDINDVMPCAGVESQLGSVQQGDSPLQLQSPLPGVTLPVYQPDPSLPATQPAHTGAKSGQHVVEPSAATIGNAAVANEASTASAALNAQEGVSSLQTAGDSSKHDAAVQEDASTAEGAASAEEAPNGQTISDKEALDRQASTCHLRSHVCSHMLLKVAYC